MNHTYEIITDLTKNGEWDVQILDQLFDKVVTHILQNAKPPNPKGENNRP